MLSLVEPRHGYGVMQYVSDLTRGGLRIGPGTLYGGALATLEERKLIVPVERDDADCGGNRRKEYALTARQASTGLGT